MAAATHRGPPKDDLPCLYCGEPKPKTDEHVVQKGLGGGAVLKHVVCGDCNTKVFSPLDKVLIQTVQELLCLQHPDLASGRTAFRWDFHYQYDEENGCWSTLRLDGAFRPRQMDQISIFPDGRVVVFLDPEQPGTFQARVDRLKEELAAPGALKLTRRIVAGKSPPVERAVIRSAANTYVLRGATETDIDDLQRIVEAGVFKTIREAEPVHSGRERPTVEGTITVDPFALQRACAKTLLNFLTFSWGVEVAARPEFGIVKRAILTGESIATFVRLAPRREADSFDEVMTRPDHHTLCITAARGMVGGSLWLYQRAIASVILASNLTLQRHASVGLFNYKTRTHRLLSVEDLAAELCPSG